MEVTAIPAGSPSSCADTAANARLGPRRHAWATSWSRLAADAVLTRWGTRTRAITWPFGSTATALTAVVPTSMPTVQSAPERRVMDLTIGS